MASAQKDLKPSEGGTQTLTALAGVCLQMGMPGRESGWHLEGAWGDAHQQRGGQRTGTPTHHTAN